MAGALAGREASFQSGAPRFVSILFCRDVGCRLTCLRVQIVVERLTKNITEDHLREVFGSYGPIQDLDLPVNRTRM